MSPTHQFTFSPGMSRVLDPDKIAEILRPLRRFRTDDDDERSLTVFGRAMWSTVVEPGDGEAGFLATELGPESVFMLADGQTAGILGALQHVPAALGEGGVDFSKALSRWLPRLDLDRVEALCRSAATIGLQFVTPEDPEWPRSLNDLGVHAPQGLWVRGDVTALGWSTRSVAIVGSRASTQYGNRVAGDLAAGAASSGVAVISGGAYGIDAQAHRATLASGGNTIAVLAGGADRLYPAGNRELLERICNEGAIVTEAPCGQAPTRWRFLQRNRVIAALAQATIVVEAGARSGALNTANHAMHLGRPLGAVPGPVTSASSVGCHRLLKDHQAELITDVADALSLQNDAAGLFSERGSSAHDGDAGADSVPVELAGLGAGLLSDLTSTALRVFDTLRPRKRREIGELARLGGLSEAEVRAGLAELQLAGLADYDSAGWRKA